MGFVAPNPNFLVHLMAPGLNVRGVSLPGIPGVLLGHNERIAWGSTALMADAQDLFIEELDSEGTRYRFRGEWLPVETWEDEILVRDRESDRVRVRLTHHGPLVQSSGRFGLALRWERLDTPPGDPTFHALNTATDWLTFRDALKSYSLPPTDFTYADVEGNVGAQSAGCVPLRAGGDGALPVPGKEGAYEWLGYVPFEELPSVYRPKRGFVVRANQNHDAGRCGHFLSLRWHPPYRARRIQALLLGSEEHTVESLAKIQFDRFSYHTAFVAERVAAAAGEGGPPFDSLGRSALALLRTWDGQLAPASPAASIAKECSALLKAKLFGSVLGKSLLLDYQRFWPVSNLAAERVLEKEDRRWLPEGTTDYPSLYRSVLTEALSNLGNVFGTKDPGGWSWGKLNVIRFAHPLETVPFFGDRFRLPPVEAGSDGECIFSSRSVSDYISSQQSAMLDWDAGRGAIFGASVRLLWDAGDWDNSSMMLNLGQSADPRSPHYKDHLEIWKSGALQKLPFSWDRVSETSVRSLRL
jgi:penicillin amidase